MDKVKYVVVVHGNRIGAIWKVKGKEEAVKEFVQKTKAGKMTFWKAWKSDVQIEVITADMIEEVVK